MVSNSPHSFRHRVPLLDGASQSQTSHMLELEGSNKFDHVKPRSEQGVLFCMHEPEINSQETFQYASNIDIVAVPGLGGDAYRTWQHDNGFNWLHNLHEEFPGSRIYSSGYESGIAFSGGLRSLNDHARYLLYSIKRMRPRSEDQQRQVVFICHGLGGLLVKQALLLANNERGIFGSLCEAIRGILFFSTPHNGTKTKDYGDILCRMADAINFPTPAEKLMETFRTALLGSLRDIAEKTSQTEDDFCLYTKDIHISTFLETSPLPGMSTVLVDDYSGNRGRVISMLDHDHRQICKHSSFTGMGIGNILDELRDIAQSNSAALASSWAPVSVIEAKDSSSSVVNVASVRNDALLRGTVTGNTRSVNRLITQGADPNACNSQGETVLLLACKQKSINIAERLLDAGADANKCDSQGKSPLHFALRRSSSELVSMILNRGGDPNVVDKNGNTPLHCAAEAGHVAIVRCLLDYGADCFLRNNLEELPAKIARKNYQFEAMGVLHDHAQNLIQESRISAIDPSRITTFGPLSSSETAVQNMARNFPSLQFATLDMDRDLKKYASKLSKLAKRGKLKAIEALLDQGIKPTAEDLYFAADNGHSDVVQILADVVDDIDAAVGFVGNSLCAAAARANNYDCLKVLLEKGANVNWLGGHYGCALQTATANYRLDNVILLVKYGADVNAQCGHYGNAITAAARHPTYFAEMSRVLLEHGADVNAQGPGVYGNALQTAVWLKHTTSVEFLLSNGANPTIRGQFGSAIDIAKNDAFRHNPGDKDGETIKRLLNEEDISTILEQL